MGLNRYPSVAGGMNDSLYAENVADNQVGLAKNCVMSLDKILEQRAGTVKLFDTATGASDDVDSIHYFPISGGTRWLLFKAGTTLYKMDLSTSTYTSLQTGLATRKASMVNFLNGSGAECMVYADGTNFAMWDGTTWTSLTIPAGYTTAPKYLEADDNVLWAAGDSVKVSRLSYSADLNPTSFGVNAFFEMDAGDGTAITGLHRMYDALAVGKERSVHMITGTSSSTFARKCVSRKVGLTSHWGIQTVGNILFFTNASGIWLGRLRAVEENGLDTEMISGNVQRAYMDQAAGSHSFITSAYDQRNGQIIWGINSSTASYYDIGLVLSTWHSDFYVARSGVGPGGRIIPDTRFVWAGKWEGLKLNSMTEIGTTDTDVDVVIGGNDGLIRQLDNDLVKDNCAVGATTGTDIAWEINTRELTGTRRVHRFMPRLFQRYNSAAELEWVVNQSKRLPVDENLDAAPRSIKFTGNVPYWHEGTDADLTETWNSTIWSERPILQGQITLATFGGLLVNSIVYIIAADGSNTLDDFAYAGFFEESTPEIVRGRG